MRTTTRWLVRGLLALGFGAALAACTPPPAAVFFLVTTTADTVDAVRGDGMCADAAGDCSLRAAVMEANTSPAVTEIQLTGGSTYTLSIAGEGEDAAATGDLDITESVYIRSNAAGSSGQATIDAASVDRVIEVHGGAYHFLEGLVRRGERSRATPVSSASRTPGSRGTLPRSAAASAPTAASCRWRTRPSTTTCR